MGDRKPQVDPEQAICGHSFLAKQDHHRGGRSECEETGRDYRAPAWGDQSNPVCPPSGPGSPQASATQTAANATQAKGANSFLAPLATTSAMPTSMRP